MRAVIIEQFGGPERMRFADIPKPVPAPGQLLIKVSHAGVNPVDWKIREGWLTSMFAHELPVTLGRDVAGTVAAVGEGVSGFHPGDRVYAYLFAIPIKHGSFAEYAPADAAIAAPIPASLDFATAAAVPLVSLTAWKALVEFCQLGRGEVLVVRNGSGGVGGYAIQLAKHLGASVYATTGPGNLDYVTTLGADVAVDYRSQNIAEVVRQAYPAGADAVFDCSGTTDMDDNFAAVREGGRVACIAGIPDLIPVLEEGGKAKGLKAGLVFVEPNGEMLREVGALIEQQAIEPLAVEALPFEAVPEALNRSQAGHVRGKLVINVEG